MTREEAIKELRESHDMMRSYNIDESESRLMTALDMAIQTLEQQKVKEIQGIMEGGWTVTFEVPEKEPCDDTVSIKKDVLKCRVGNIVAYNVEWLKKHWQMEMEIVCGVEPCDDAISRKSVNTLVDELARAISDERCHIPQRGRDAGHIMHDILDLPSVTQKSETVTELADRCRECGKSYIRIPDNATNGDVIKAMFPNREVDDYDYGKDPVIDVYGIDDTEYITLRKDWWNSPYQKGGKDEVN